MSIDCCKYQLRWMSACNDGLVGSCVASDYIDRTTAEDRDLMNKP